eukprot:gene40430-64333_t
MGEITRDAGAKIRGGNYLMIRLRNLALTSVAVLALAGGVAPAMAQSVRSSAAAAKKDVWPGLPPGAVEEYMALRDGVRLGANVFKPAGAGPWPVVLSRTPYLKDGRIDRERDPDGAKNREGLAKQA